MQGLTANLLFGTIVVERRDEFMARQDQPDPDVNAPGTPTDEPDEQEDR